MTNDPHGLPSAAELWRLAAIAGHNGRWMPTAQADRVAKIARLLAAAAQETEWLESVLAKCRENA